MARSMVSAWSSFAKTADVNTPGWGPYVPGLDNWFVLATPNSYSVSGWRASLCDMWDSIGYRF